MGCGLPVLASDAKPMKRVIEQEQCGRVFSSGNASELTKALLDMRGREKEFGANGRRAVLERYNWQEDSQRLLRLVEGIGSKRH
jgi:glycosyltransferase involved in cell wall biosynthesis